MPTPKQDYVLVSSEKHIKEYTSSKAVDLHSAYDDASLEPSVSLIQPLTWSQMFASKYNKLWYNEGEDLHATQVLFFKVLREGFDDTTTCLVSFCARDYYKWLRRLTREKADS